MPSRDYEKGFTAGVRYCAEEMGAGREMRELMGAENNPHPKKRRKLSAWNKFVKANSKKPRFKYRDGKLNLKKMGVAFRKTPAGRKKKR